VVSHIFAERVEIIAGLARYKVGRTELSATTGDVVVLSKDVPHTHPWNVGNEVLHWRIIIQAELPI